MAALVCTRHWLKFSRGGDRPRKPPSTQLGTLNQGQNRTIHWQFFSFRVKSKFSNICHFLLRFEPVFRSQRSLRSSRYSPPKECLKAEPLICFHWPLVMNPLTRRWIKYKSGKLNRQQESLNRVKKNKWKSACRHVFVWQNRQVLIIFHEHPSPLLSCNIVCSQNSQLSCLCTYMFTLHTNKV